MDLTARMTVSRGTFGYQVMEGDTSVDLLGALRITKLELDADLDISLAGPLTFRDKSLSGDVKETWYDVVVGMQVLHAITDNVDLMGYFDVGGG